MPSVGRPRVAGQLPRVPSSAPNQEPCQLARGGL